MSGYTKYQPWRNRRLIAAMRAGGSSSSWPNFSTVGADIIAPPVTSRVPIREGTNMMVSLVLRSATCRSATILDSTWPSCITAPRRLINPSVRMRLTELGLPKDSTAVPSSAETPCPELSPTITAPTIKASPTCTLRCTNSTITTKAATMPNTAICVIPS